MNEGSNRDLATRVRAHALRMTHRSGSSHVGSCLSVADVLAVLYDHVLRVDPARPDWAERDRFILSKGHAAAALYAVLAESGFFPTAWLDEYCRDGTKLAGHVSHDGVPGVEVSTGSLGHGLPIACGMALAAKRQGLSWRVFCVLSDGECDEGSTWEAALFAGHHGLDNLIVIIDYNKIQSLGRVDEVMRLDPLDEKWAAFGWGVREIDGHDVDALHVTLTGLPLQPTRPSCVIAHTVKGNGVSFMEDLLLWHYRAPSEDELRRALAELGATS